MLPCLQPGHIRLPEKDSGNHCIGFGHGYSGCGAYVIAEKAAVAGKVLIKQDSIDHKGVFLGSLEEEVVVIDSGCPVLLINT